MAAVANINNDIINIINNNNIIMDINNIHQRNYFNFIRNRLYDYINNNENINNNEIQNYLENLNDDDQINFVNNIINIFYNDNNVVNINNNEINDANIPHNLDQHQQEEGNDEEMPLPRCCICFASNVAVVFNCGHMCACMGCSNRINQCPICRTNIVRRQRVYFP